jgi:death on curing protein
MSDPIWVPLIAVYVIHDRQISRYGVASGLLDKALLEAAIDRL